MSLSNRSVSTPPSRIFSVMPKLWTETIETHRREVRDATLDTAAALVAKRGVLSVTMSVEAILLAWHERQITGHLEHLTTVRDKAGDPGERLTAVLEAYALITHEHHGTELAAILHRGEHVARAQQQLHDMIRGLLTAAAEAGDVRDDVAPAELASYCLSALAGASSLRSKAAVRRLVTVTLAGLRRGSARSGSSR